MNLRAHGLLGRTVVGSAIVGSLVIVAFAVLGVALAALRTTADRSDRSSEVLVTSARLEKALLDVETGQRGYVITHDSRFLEPWYAGRAAAVRDAHLLVEQVGGDEGQRRRAVGIQRAIHSYLRDWSIPTVAAARRNADDGRSLVASGEGKRRVDAIRARFDRLNAVEHRLRLEGRDRTALATKVALGTAVGALVALVALLALFAWLLVVHVVRPLRTLASAAEKVGGGDLGARVPDDDTTEIGALARAFNRMTLELANERREIADAHEHLASLLESSPLAIVTRDPDLVVTSWNPAAERIFGWSADEVVGAHGAVALADDTPWANIMATTAAGGSVDGVVLESRRKDGETIWISVASAPLRSGDGGVAGIVSVIRDVTADRHRQRQLDELHTRFEQAFENAPIGVALVDPGGRWLKVNPALCQMLGYEREELLERTFADVTHPDDVVVDLELAARVLAGELPRYDLDKRYVRKDGVVVWASLSVSLVRPAGGQPYFVSQVHDITQRRRAEEALAASEARHRLLAENSSDLITLLDEDGVCLYASPATRTLLELQPEDVVGRMVHDFFHEDDVDALAAAQRENLHGGIASVLHRLRRADGTYVWVETTSRGILDADGNVIEIQTATRDVTARKQAEDELREVAERLARSNRDLEDFAYVASHDLQEPLRKIQAFGERLGSKYGTELPDGARDYVDRMRNAAGRLQHLVQDLLTYSRVSTHAGAPQELDVADVVREVLADLEAAIEDAGATVEIGPLPTVHADRTQLRQLLQNLIANALKFHKPGETPTVRVRALPAPAGRCAFAVEDDGIGFEPRYADQIFTVFERLHARDAYDGTGIGLSVCRKIVERHGGTIVAMGEAGVGARFVVTLPVTAEEDDIAA